MGRFLEKFIIAKEEKREVNDCCLADTINFRGQKYQNHGMNLSTVFACVNYISDSIATLPIKVKMKNGKCIDELSNHPLNIVLSERNVSNLSKYNFIKLIIQSVILRGNGFAYINRAKDGTVTSLRYLEASDVTIQYNKQTDELYYISSLIKGRISPKDILHFKKYSYDGINGISVLTFANRSIDLGNAAENNALDFYKDGSNLNGILTVQGQLSDKQREQIKNSWESGTGRLKVLQGSMSYQPLSISPEDAQLLSTRKYNAEDVCRFFGISPSLIGIGDKANYSTLEQEQKAYVLHTLLPYVQMMEEEMNRKLLSISEANLFIDFEEDFIMKSDNTSMANYLSTLINSGVLCIDEARNMLGLSEIGLTQHIIPYTDITMNEINNNKKE